MSPAVSGLANQMVNGEEMPATSLVVMWWTEIWVLGLGLALKCFLQNRASECFEKESAVPCSTSYPEAYARSKPTNFVSCAIPTSPCSRDILVGL